MFSTRSAVLVAAALLAAACGGGGSGSPAAPSPTGNSGGSGGNGSGIVTINIVGVNGKLSFNPNPANVPAGQTVVFRNNDVVTHRVVLDDNSINTGDIAPGASSQPLPLGGVSKPYHCSMHPSMVGSLNSAATPDPEPCTGYCG